MFNRNYTYKTLLLEILFILLAVLFLFPLYLIVINSFKSFSEIMQHTLSLPDVFMPSNYIKAWKSSNFPRTFLNSFLVTSFSIIGLVIIGSMCAWRLARTNTWWSIAIYFLFVSTMVIPFQTIMLPFVQVTSFLNFINSIPGLILTYFGFSISITIFLYHGFIKSIPLEIEESAYIDGCNAHTLFWKIIFPLLKPITATVIILNGIFIWNDFLLPLLMLQESSLHTIPVAMYSFFSQYEQQWDLALAMLVLAMLPIIILFLVMQKFIIKGIMAGSIK